MLSNTSLSMQIGFQPSQTTKVISKAILQTLIYKQNDSTGNVSLYRAIGWDFNHLTSPVQSSGNNNNNNNNLLLIRRKYLYEYIQMRLTSYIKIIIK